MFNADNVEVSILGTKIKVNKNESQKLEIAESEFNKELAKLTDRIENQDTTIGLLNNLNTKLINEVANCSEVKTTVQDIGNKIKTLKLENEAVKRDYSIFKNMSVIEFKTKSLN